MANVTSAAPRRATRVDDKPPGVVSAVGGAWTSSVFGFTFVTFSLVVVDMMLCELLSLCGSEQQEKTKATSK